MSTLNETIFTGQKGTKITASITKIVSGAEVAVDLTNATVVEIQFKRPDGTLFKKTATRRSPFTSGVIDYTNNEGTSIFDKRGRWQAQGLATFSNGDYFPGTWKGFTVDES